MKMTEKGRMVAAGMAGGGAQAGPGNPNFSGTWNLNLAESFLANEHPADDYQLTKVIEQTSGSIKITDIAKNVSVVNIPMPNSTTTTNLIPDGKPRQTQGSAPFPGRPAPQIAESAEWQGGTLFVTQRGQGMAASSTTHHRYFLSENGSRLVELVDGFSLSGDSQRRLVFDRQGKPE